MEIFDHRTDFDGQANGTNSYTFLLTFVHVAQAYPTNKKNGAKKTETNTNKCIDVNIKTL